MSEANILEQYGIGADDLECAVLAIKEQAERAERSLGGQAMHLQTKSVAEMFETEYRLAQLCADMGNAQCCLLIGELLQGGKVKAPEGCDGVAEAMKWWEKGAEAGMERCYTNIGLISLHKPIPGGGKSFGSVPYDEEKAFNCFVKAYELGDKKAGRHVGLCYFDGIGTQKDEEKAFGYFSAAMERGDSTATLYVADCLLKGTGTAQDTAKAIEIYKHLHEIGGHDVTTSAYALACIYRDGIYARRDTALAERYFRSVLETADAHTADLYAEAKKNLGIE